MPPLGRKPPVRRPAASSPPKTQPLAKTPDLDQLVSQIANFYAGKPVSVSYGDRNTTGLAGSANITLDPQVKASLQALTTDPGKGIMGLGTLIHEALHTRGPDNHGPSGSGTYDPKTGFYSWDDEWQARQLSYNLIPDAMKRFFGIAPDSPQGQRLGEAAKGYGYEGGFGPPKTGFNVEKDPRVHWW